MTSSQLVTVDLPCDVQRVDGNGFVWTFLHEAADPAVVVDQAIVVAGDEADPVLARVVALTDRPGGVKVHLDILRCDPDEVVQALVRSGLVPGASGP